jgi:hypothetical protein
MAVVAQAFMSATPDFGVAETDATSPMLAA